MEKILCICTLKDGLVRQYEKLLNYHPLPDTCSDKDWLNLIEKYKPRAILFGIQNLNKTRMKIWREICPYSELHFVRKGVSLHRVDFSASEQYSIGVHKIPAVNAPFVADYINRALFHTEFSDVASIIGVGQIGALVAQYAMKHSRHTLLYNRTKKHFDALNFAYHFNLDDLFQKSQKIALCLPLTPETQGLIQKQHIDFLMPGATFVCVSPPKVVSAAAIKILHQREDLSVTFDHVDSGLKTINDALGHLELRPGFVFKEAAASSYECQYAMGLEAIKLCQSLQGLID